MLPDDCKRIRSKFKDIVKNIRVDEILDCLVSDGVLDEEDVEEVESEKTPSGKVRRLLRLLLQKQGDNVYESFCRALNETGYDYIVECLTNADISGIHDEPDSVGRGEKNAEELRNQIVRQSAMIMDLQEQYQKEIRDLKEQLDAANVNSLASLKDAVDGSHFRDPYVHEYIKQLCHADKKSLNTLVVNGNHAVNNGATLPAYVWNLIRANVIRTEPVKSLTVEEESCRIGIYVSRCIAMSQGGSGCANDAGKIGKSSEVMRCVVEGELKRNASRFDDAVKMLDRCELEGYSTFETIADHQFGDGQCNWGRIIAWFTFWARIASRLPDEGREETTEVFGRFVGFYLSCRIGDWIVKAGGWDGFVKKYESCCRQPSSGGGLLWSIAMELFRNYP